MNKRHYEHTLPNIRGSLSNTYHQWWMVLTISILMLMAILTDYFLFHYVSDRIKELTRVNKELAELKEEHKE